MDRDERLELLLSRANIRGFTPKDIPGSGGRPILTAHDIYMAMAMKELSMAAGEIGVAVYMQDPLASIQIRRRGQELIAAMFKRENWNAQQPYQMMVNAEWRGGILTRAQALAKKEYLGSILITTMTNLALNEIINPGLCEPCKGRGTQLNESTTSVCHKCEGKGKRSFIDLNDRLASIAEIFGMRANDMPAYRWFSNTCAKCNGAGRHQVRFTCQTCGGSGKVKYSQRFIANTCQINESTWCKTWQQRYVRIVAVFERYLDEFERHLLDTC